MTRLTCNTSRRRLLTAAMFFFFSGGLFSSCSDSKGPENPLPEPAGQHFTIAAWLDDPQYLASTPSLMDGSLSFVGNGIETRGSRYLVHGNYLYVMNTNDKKFNQFEMGKDGKITLKASILSDGVVPNYFMSLNAVDNNTLLVLGGVEGKKGVAGWAQIEVPSFKVVAKGTLTVPYDASKPGVEFYLGRGYVDNGKFILGGYFYDNEAKSYVADGVKAIVYDYPAMTNMRVIQSKATSGGIGYDYLSSLDKDEQGNHYFVASAGKYWTGTGGKSGIVRIKKGEDKFDDSYFFDVTSQLGKQACLMGMNYVSNGIAFGTVQYEEMMTSVKDRLKNVGQIVKLDLVNKKAIVTNTPLSPVSMVRSPLVLGGKYYNALCINGGEAAIYEFDPKGDGNSFKKGIKLTGNGLMVQVIAKNASN